MWSGGVGGLGCYCLVTLDLGRFVCVGWRRRWVGVLVSSNLGFGEICMCGVGRRWVGVVVSDNLRL